MEDDEELARGYTRTMILLKEISSFLHI